MLKKNDILNLSLALFSANDEGLIFQDGIYSEKSLTPGDKGKIVEVANVVFEICRDYSYIESLNFKRDVSSKSDKYIDMMKKMESDPVKEKARNRVLREHIVNVLADVESLKGLLPEEKSDLADRLKHSVQALPYPD